MACLRPAERVIPAGFEHVLRVSADHEHMSSIDSRHENHQTRSGSTTSRLVPFLHHLIQLFAHDSIRVHRDTEALEPERRGGTEQTGVGFC